MYTCLGNAEDFVNNLRQDKQYAYDKIVRERNDVWIHYASELLEMKPASVYATCYPIEDKRINEFFEFIDGNGYTILGKRPQYFSMRIYVGKMPDNV